LNKINLLLHTCRFNQWTKNFLVFAGPIFLFNFDIEIWIYSFGAFISFCLMSSSIYIFNDFQDIEDDKLHPTKKNRPIASGKISKRNAIKLQIFCLAFSLLIALFINKFLLLVLLIYMFLQFIYSNYLKNKPLADILCISSGFLLRAISGGISSGIFISHWFLLTIGLFSLFLAVEKRKKELRDFIESGIKTRAVLKRYSLPLLDRVENLAVNGGFVSYSLWASGPALNGASTSLMLLTVPFVLAGILRYQLLSDPVEIERRSYLNCELNIERPEEIILKDKITQLIIIIWILLTLSIGYLN
jgi:4-hydroxybenzoate polyprenyltransferase